MKKLLLIDGSNLLFRSYYATAAMGNLMQNSQGVYTNGIYGLVSSMQTVLSMEFTHLLVAMDPKGKTKRHLLFESYKGTRKEAPSELKMQFPLMEEYFKEANIPYYYQDLYEADDVIGYCATHYKEEFDEITIISNDHDLMQLLDKNVRQMVSKKGFSEVEIFTPEVMLEKLGILPKQMIDYKGLVGDTSDNIPGIKGIGDKTAQKLLQEYGTLENVYQNTEALKGKLKERIEEGQELAFFSKKLATIETDFENDITIDFMEYHGFDYDKLLAFYQKLEFHQFIKKMNKPLIEKSKKQKFEYQLLTTSEEVQKILKPNMSVYLELFGLNYHTSERIGFALFDGEKSYFLRYDFATQNQIFMDWLSSESIPKSTFDLKQTLVSLLWDHHSIQGVDFDLLLASYLINPNITKEDFKIIVSSFDYNDVSYDEEIYQKGAKYSIPEDISVVYENACKKAQAIYLLKPVLLQKIEEYSQTKLLNEIELPLSVTLAKMEYQGILIDQDKLQEIGQDLKKKIDELEIAIYDLAGEDFNINSPKQLGVILFEKLELPYSKKTKSGYSTDVSVLSQIQSFHPIVSLVMDYRTYTKLYSTYYEGLKSALTIKNDGKIHTIYMQALTQTGRLSSIEPNLQNIPVRTEEGKELRKIFISHPSTKLYSCDYSQIELRVLAHMGKVKNLQSAFLENEDIHTSTAKRIFKTEQITTLMRRQAKAINFGIIYGKTVWGLSEDLHIPPKQAERFIQDYFDNYPEIKIFMDEQIEHAQKFGYVETIFSRRRYIPEVNSNQYQTREFGKRMAMNAPIQGSAADILKIAMVNIDQEMTKQNLKSKMLLQIHDELVFEIEESEIEVMTNLIREKMEHVLDFSVPLLIEASLGENLYEVK